MSIIRPPPEAHDCRHGREAGEAHDCRRLRHEERVNLRRAQRAVVQANVVDKTIEIAPQRPVPANVQVGVVLNDRATARITVYPHLINVQLLPLP